MQIRYETQQLLTVDTLMDFSLPAETLSVLSTKARVNAEIWSSPLKRAVETAELVTGQDPQTDAALIEMDWGDWEGHHGKKLIADPASGYRHIEDWGWDYTPPGGEPPSALRSLLCPPTSCRMEVAPSFETFKHLATQGNLIPVYTDLMADFETPVSVYSKLRALGPAYLLESIEGGASLNRYSFIGCQPVPPSSEA